MGLPLEMKPNYEDFSCQFRWGRAEAGVPQLGRLARLGALGERPGPGQQRGCALYVARGTAATDRPDVPAAVRSTCGPNIGPRCPAMPLLQLWQDATARVRGCSIRDALLPAVPHRAAACGSGGGRGGGGGGGGGAVPQDRAQHLIERLLGAQFPMLHVMRRHTVARGPHEADARASSGSGSVSEGCRPSAGSPGGRQAPCRRDPMRRGKGRSRKPKKVCSGGLFRGCVPERPGPAARGRLPLPSCMRPCAACVALDG